jgi:hypothetical protein
MEELIEDTSRSVSTLVEESSSLSPIESVREDVQDGSQATHASRSRLPAQTPSSADEWLCRHCGRSFTHRYKLKYSTPTHLTSPRLTPTVDTRSTTASLIVVSIHPAFSKELLSLLERISTDTSLSMMAVASTAHMMVVHVRSVAQKVVSHAGTT